MTERDPPVESRRTSAPERLLERDRPPGPDRRVADHVQLAHADRRESEQAAVVPDPCPRRRELIRGEAGGEEAAGDRRQGVRGAEAVPDGRRPHRRDELPLPSCRSDRSDPQVEIVLEGRPLPLEAGADHLAHALCGDHPRQQREEQRHGEQRHEPADSQATNGRHGSPFLARARQRCRRGGVTRESVF